MQHISATTKMEKGSGVISGHKVPTKLKCKFYCIVLSPVILYGDECWTLKQQHKRNVKVIEMRMLR